MKSLILGPRFCVVEATRLSEAVSSRADGILSWSTLETKIEIF